MQGGTLFEKEAGTINILRTWNIIKLRTRYFNIKSNMEQKEIKEGGTKINKEHGTLKELSKVVPNDN